MAEVWKPVQKFSSYEVSSLGRLRRVRDYDSQGPRKLLPYILNTTVRARIRGDNHRLTQVSLARLVARAFYPTTKTGLVVGYRDGNKRNLSASNLGWQLRPSPRWEKDKRIGFWVDSLVPWVEN